MTQQIVKVVMKGRLLSTVETRNIHYYGADTITPDATVCTALEDAIEAAYNIVNDSLSDTLTFYGVDSYRWVLDNSQPPQYWWEPVHAQDVSIVGGSTADLSAFQTAALLVFKTAVKKCLGRKFIPGIAEDMVTDGSAVAGFVTVLGTFAAALLASQSVSGVSWYPGVPSKNSVFAPFLTASVGTILSTMRRRKPGYGI